MARKSLHIKKYRSVNIFQAFTDLMSNAFMILCMFLLLAFLQSQRLNERLKSAFPIVIDERSREFRFTSGSAELNPELKNYLQTEIIPTIQTTLQEKEIDFIQVIGHTDGQEVNQLGNLDQNIEKVAKGEQKITQLIPGSNTDLGLMRALAVVEEIQQTINSYKEYKDIEFRAYSAGQLYLPDGTLANVNRNADATRRRIEIRFIPPGESNQNQVSSSSAIAK